MDPAGTGTPPSTGATVSTWIDKSVSALTSIKGGTPTYVSGGGVNFDGSSFFYNLSFAQNLSQRSIFIVYKETTYDTNGLGIFNLIPNPSTGQDSETVTGLSIEATYGWRVWGNGGGDQSDFFLTSPVAKAIFNNNMNGTAGSGFLNGTSITSRTASYTAGTCSGYGVGARWRGSTSMSSGLNGKIYEIIFFNSPLGLSDRQSIEGYLAQKWSLTGSLPAGHPGLTQNFLMISSTPSDKITLIPSNQPINYGIVYGIPYPPTYIKLDLVYHLDAGNPASYSGSGSTWNDLAGSGITATLYNSPTYSSSSGGSLLFNGTTQYAATTSSIATISGTGTSWTIEVFIYYNATNGGVAPCIFANNYLSPNNLNLPQILGAISPGANISGVSSPSELQVGYYVRNGGASSFYITPEQSPLTSGNWYHIVGTYDRSTLRLYINNNLSQSTASTTGTLLSNTIGYSIMSTWSLTNNPTSFWGGNLAILRLYKRALSTEEIDYNWTKNRSRFGI
jgi:hypothetical protein